jgi:hypothetical protein
MNYEESFPELADFLNCSFHQDGLAVLDWQGREPNDRDATQFYKTLCKPEDIAKITEELRKFLRLPLTDKEIHKAIWSLGIFHNPTYSGVTFRAWLEEILEVFEDPSTATYLRFDDPNAV